MKKEEKRTCCECGNEIVGDFVEYGGEVYCQECFDELFFTCDDCGEIYSKDYGYYVESEDRYVCDNCLDNNYFKCEECGEYHRECDGYTINDGRGDYFTICQDCFDNGYYYCCDDCGDYFHEDDMYFRDGYAYCNECYQNNSHGIYDYHEFDDWVFYKGNNEENPKYYIGAEIELEPHGYSNVSGVVDAIENINAVGMHDGSLQDGGVEVVTHPETPQYREEHKKDYMEFFNDIKNINYGNAGGCGLHFHVSRPNDDIVSRVIVILESFKDEIKKLSRRRESQLDHWAKFLTDNCCSDEKIKYQSTKWLKEKYIKNYHDRYFALNLTNDHTIEFRFFNGADNFEEFWAAYQFIKNLMDIALDENRELNTIKWADLLQGEELINQAQKLGVFDIDKTAKDTSDIIEIYEKAVMKTKEEIKRTLLNLARYINKEMSELDIKSIKASDINQISEKCNDFIVDFKYRKQYLERVTNLHEALTNNDGIKISDIKDYWENTKSSYPNNTKRYKRYDKMIEKSIKNFESEVR